jgi:hypothetical protein
VSTLIQRISGLALGPPVLYSIGVGVVAFLVDFIVEARTFDSF